MTSRTATVKHCFGPLLLATALLLPAARASAPTVSESSVPVIVDRQLVGGALVRDGVAYLPLRTLARHLGLDVRYDADSQIIVITTPSAKRENALPAIQ